ncbi:hypothetical protein Tco_1244900 [Tanacetum coccineum]
MIIKIAQASHVDRAFLEQVDENEVFQDLQLIQKLRDDQKCMKKVVPSSRSKVTEDIISIGSFVKVLGLNQYVLVRGEAIKVGFNPLVHSFCALSTLRRSGLRTASAAAKPCQGDSLEFYLITGRISTVAAAGQRHVNSQPHAHTSYS